MIAISLKPSPAFCVKTSLLQDALFKNNNVQQQISSSLLELPPPSTISIPKGLKVFVNIAWDKNVPPPPEGSEEAIQKAMLGEEIEEENPGGWYVPTIVSQGRQDTDRAGKPSLVFDAVFSSSLKSRCVKDPEFKTFLVELAFQRIEAQTGDTIILSRQIATPNIASKGQLGPRTVQIPAVLYPAGHPLLASNQSPAGGVVTPKPKGKKLIEEVDPTRDAKGILKVPTSPTQTSLSEGPRLPKWTWTKTDTQVKIVVEVPSLTHEHVRSPYSTLDLEPRRIVLTLSASTTTDEPIYFLDINLDASDAELVATFSSSDSPDQDAQNALTLKRVRDLDVSRARAEWRVAEMVLVIYA